MNVLRPEASWTALALSAGSRVRIEASAGTGKTWTISVLYLRLLLEHAWSPRQILVATFSEAAAQELHERLRRRLIWAERIAAGAASIVAAGVAPEAIDADLRYLRDLWQDDPARRARDRLRLRLALSELDIAPIGTLHGICRRILAEHPFDSASAFDTGELVSAAAIREEMLADLKRQLAQSTQPLSVGDQRWLAEFGKLARALERVADPQVRLLAPEPVDIAAIMVRERADEVRAFADDATRFVRSNGAYRSQLYRLAAYIDAGDLSVPFEKARRLVDMAIDDQLKPDLLPILRGHPVIGFAAFAAAGLERYDSVVRAEALARHREQLERWREQRLRERGQFTFDTLIERVDLALHAPGSELADRLHASWPVALIDEFQDTDARQFAILDRIYRDGLDAPRGLLVMIGDPKQAIYAFRGGDIHVYRRAVRQVDEAISLDTNQRASAAYVAGLNAFYALVAPGLSRSGAADPLPYREVRASHRRDAQPYTIDGVAVAQPLVLHYRDEVPDAKGLRVREALRACAAQIAGMLQVRTHRIGDRALQPADIAVLLPRNEHIVALRALLIECGVPCAGVGQQSVFQTPWATELQLILHALAHRDQAGALRAALSTRLLGMDFDDIARLDQDPGAWQAALERCLRLHELWQRQGVLAVVQHLLQHAPASLRGSTGFERIVTDLRHLGELLQEASQSCHGPEQLLAWLSAQRREPESGNEAAEEQQLRIESDAARVRLLTLHASKGLEFAVVFLPLMWAHQRSVRTAPFPVVHDDDSATRVADLGTSQYEARCLQADEDDQDERFRVLYVALTRAQYACHVYALPPTRPRDARQAVACADPERSALDALIERALAARARDPAMVDSLPGLRWCADGWPWPFVRYQADREQGANAIVVPTLPEPRAPRSVHSFSTLVRSARANEVEEAPAVDEDELGAGDPLSLPEAIGSVVERSPHPLLQALDEVRGAALGNALHLVLEQRAPAEPVAGMLPRLVAAMRQFDVRPRHGRLESYAQLWLQRLSGALDCDLGGGLRLAGVPASAQCAELEFHFAVDEVQLRKLRQICAQHGQPDLIPQGLGTPMLNGLLTGKIDLVLEHDGRFHVLDYKGNALSVHVEDYLPAALEAAMDLHHYRFQSLLYVLAVDRMLGARLPDYQRERHLGDAIYLFLRAAGLHGDAGIWRCRHAPGLIDDLQRALSSVAVAA